MGKLGNIHPYREIVSSYFKNMVESNVHKRYPRKVRWYDAIEVNKIKRGVSTRIEKNLEVYTKGLILVIAKEWTGVRSGSFYVLHFLSVVEIFLS